MTPTAIIALIELILREAPGAINGIRALLNKNNPTDADFEAAKAQIAADTFQSLVPNAAAFKEPKP